MRYRFNTWLIIVTVICSACSTLSRKAIYLEYESRDISSANGVLQFGLDSNGYIASDFKGGKYSYEYNYKELEHIAPMLNEYHEKFDTKQVSMLGMRYHAFFDFERSESVQNCSLKKLVIIRNKAEYLVNVKNIDVTKSYKGKKYCFYRTILVNKSFEDNYTISISLEVEGPAGKRFVINENATFSPTIKYEDRNDLADVIMSI